MTLRDLWSEGRVSYGAWCTIPSSWTAEIAARSGYDWVCIDTQHGLIGYDAMLPMLQACAAGRAPTFVRVPWNQPADIMKALDAGAEGVIVPMVNSAEEARQAVGACRYAPAGFRSMGPIRARVVLPDSGPRSSAGVVCVVMIETKDAIANLDAILDVPGIDGVFVGPNDLAVSLGVTPTYKGEDPEHRRAIETIASACARRAIPAGIMCGTPEVAEQWRRAGFRFLAIESDTRLLTIGSEQAVRKARDLASQQAPARA